MPITIFSPAAMAVLAISANTAAEAAMARRLEIRIFILSVGWLPVFSSSRPPICRPSLRPGWADIPTLYAKKSTGKQRNLHEKYELRHARGGFPVMPAYVCPT
ncbi:hypothetical protein LJR235_002008 [Pararhizobium sp. LjRoot235]|uniref:hypothetical protein n=1 Tax=Pararhizobium sp. LjRoot235 TaxID=3342291 RepID=UPI003ED0EC05